MTRKNLQTLKRIEIIALAAFVSICCAACAFPTGNNGGEFRINLTEIQIVLESSVQLTTNADGDVLWVSLDEEIATVDENGIVTALNLGTVTILALFNGVQAECKVTVVEPTGDTYTLIWWDEFDGESLDMSKWSYQTGTRDVYGESKGPINWGNEELQYYREENIKLENGMLVITAQKEEEKVGGKSFTSGRITTRGNFFTLYGYVEARIKLPAVSGMWPAFWMLPQPTSTTQTGNEYGGWARNGELDIMEARGRIPTEIDTTLHFGGNWPQNTYKSNKAYLETPITEWHTYAVDWRKEYIAWIVDGVETFRLTYDQWWTAAVSADENPYAPYDKPFYILLNLAVGGTYDTTGANDIKANENFTSASMYVDYVRVYALNQ